MIIKNEAGYIYLIVQSKHISPEMISGIKASILLKEIIDLESGSYLFIKYISNTKHRNSLTINTIQKIYDLLINKSVTVYIVDNKGSTYVNSHNNANENTINLDTLYSSLNFKYVSQIITKADVLYFVVSYIDPTTKNQITNIFPTVYVSGELFSRNNLLNSHELKSNIDMLNNDYSIVNNNYNNNIIDINKSIYSYGRKKDNIDLSYCNSCNNLQKLKHQYTIYILLILSFLTLIYSNFQNIYYLF